jgi:hypothetical protein
VKSADVYQVREEDDTVLKNVCKLRPWYIDPLSAVLWKVRGDLCGGEEFSQLLYSLRKELYFCEFYFVCHVLVRSYPSLVVKVRKW